MPFNFVPWHIPIDAAKCAAINYTISCPVNAYSNATSLPDKLKLKPNNDVSGPTVIKTFLAGTIMALILSGFLIFDKIKYHFYHCRHSANSRAESDYYLRLTHVFESLLLAISDQQVLAGIALLLAINTQACEITAYHYNLVCSMLLLSAITHLNTLINIADFIHRSRSLATYRIVGIAAQLVLSGIVLSARNTKTFPSKPSALGALPAACFQNMNATHSIGLGDFIDLATNVTGLASNNTQNGSQILDNIQAATSARTGLTEYITLVAFVVLAIFFIVMELVDAKFFPMSHMHWFSIFLSSTSTVAGAVITALTLSRYNTLRTGMEVDKWFDGTNEQKWSFSQLLPLFLLIGGTSTIIKAITESLTHHKARRYANAAQRAVNNLVAAKNQIDAVGQYDSSGVEL